VGRVVADDEQIVDSVILGEEELGQREEGRDPGVFSSEEGLLDEPLVDEGFQTDLSVEVEGVEEGNGLFGVDVDQPGVNEHQRLDDRRESALGELEDDLLKDFNVHSVAKELKVIQGPSFTLEKTMMMRFPT
jgi:hypothetical protein